MIKIKVDLKKLIEGEPGLSARQVQIIAGMVIGMDGNTLAEKLHISTKTLSTHKGRVFEKMDVFSVPELVALCLSKGYAVIEDVGPSLQAKAIALRKRGFEKKGHPLSVGSFLGEHALEVV